MTPIWSPDCAARSLGPGERRRCHRPGGRKMIFWAIDPGAPSMRGAEDSLASDGLLVRPGEAPWRVTRPWSGVRGSCSERE